MKRLSIFVSIFLILNFFTVAKDIPNGWGKVKLGMSLDDTKDALKSNSDFGYHGDRDVSLLPGENRVLIETDATRGLGSNYLERCWFQFSDEKLYIIIINVNTAKMDYYSVFTTLCEKYGEPSSLNPEKAVWKDDDITMSLEKPLTLKYVDNKTFEKLQSQSTVKPSVTEMTRDMFLESL